MNAEGLTKDERSMLLYAESCIVDSGGLLEGARMNGDDMAALAKFQGAGLLTFGRIPAALLGAHRMSAKPTHWVRFTDAAWTLAHACRKRRAEQVGPYARSVFEEVASFATPMPSGEKG